jgi:predicted SAM-dependent methyltransferase
VKLHVGSGTLPLAGWVNVDMAGYAGVDVALDVRHGLPFEDVTLIFAEHFLEHLTLAEGLSFLRECRRVLNDDGVLRISTPNLDWVWLTHYKPPEAMTDDERLLGCLEMNRAFHGWGHRFLYNFQTLTLALRASGFASITPQEYGTSDLAELRGMERHERHQDRPGAPSVLIVEASGRGDSSGDFDERVAPYVRDMV